MNRAKDFRRQAREALSDHWASAVGTTLVASILGADVTLSGGGGVGGIASNVANLMNDSSQSGGSGWTDTIPAGVFMYIAAALVAMATVLVIVGIIQLIVGSFVSLGLVQYNLDLIDGKEVTIGKIFSKSSMLGKAIFLRIRMAVFTFLWSLLFVIPGIIKAYSYSMSAYIMTENPEMSAKEAMEVSMKMMKGNKWRFFCLELSFIGWSFLCVLTVGIGYLWLVPYMNAAYTAFYDEVSRNEF